MQSAVYFLTAMPQLPLEQAGQLLLVIGISFAIITLISSTIRFHRMIQMNEEELESEEDRNNFFFVQVTRYLGKINRTSSGFGVIIVEVRPTEPTQLNAAQSEMLNLLKRSAREECDKVCFYQHNRVAAIIDTDEDRVEAVAERIAKNLSSEQSGLPSVAALKVGASIFPMHGIKTQDMIDAAEEALDQTSYEQPDPFTIAAPPEADDKPVAEELGELSRQDKNSSLDPLTGVLKPEVIGSYMRKYLMEIRRKKNPAIVLCVGVNRMEQMIELHGEGAVDAIVAGVSNIIQKLTRDSDLIGRFHRDDFLILAPCSLEHGAKIADRLRAAVQKEVFMFEGKRIKAAISVGVSAHPEHGRHLRDLFRAAYAALCTIRKWETSTTLVYDPTQHGEKLTHE
jgi:diguanylate cyclase (GGDEF)-like protein